MLEELSSEVTEARNITTETFVWEGVTILVSYEPDWLGLGAKGIGTPYAHLEVQVLEPKGAPLPITETGYKSEFCSVGEVEEAGGPVAIVTALLEEFAETKTWRVRRARWEQQDLFG